MKWYFFTDYETFARALEEGRLLSFTERLIEDAKEGKVNSYSASDQIGQASRFVESLRRALQPDDFDKRNKLQLYSSDVPSEEEQLPIKMGFELENVTRNGHLGLKKVELEKLVDIGLPSVTDDFFKGVVHSIQGGKYKNVEIYQK
ncbi:hypothetical protein ACFLZX_06215 [Nanoarchaeota archaeon]